MANGVVYYISKQKDVDIGRHNISIGMCAALGAWSCRRAGVVVREAGVRGAGDDGGAGVAAARAGRGAGRRAPGPRCARARARAHQAPAQAAAQGQARRAAARTVRRHFPTLTSLPK